MKKLTSKKKYTGLKILGVVFDVVTIFGLTSIGVLLGFDKLWNNIEIEGITSFAQWISLVLYRFGIYLIPGIILSFFVFDKRFKYTSRLIIWLNWTLCLYLIANAFIRVFAIDKINPNFRIFNTIDSVVLLVGYVITFATKKKVEFDSTEAIIDPKAKD